MQQEQNKLQKNFHQCTDNIEFIYLFIYFQFQNFDALHSTDCDLVKKSLHDLHNYSAIQCNFKRRDTQIPVVIPAAQNINSKSASVKEKPVKDTSSVSVKNEGKKKSMKETQAALFFGGKTSKDNKEG